MAVVPETFVQLLVLLAGVSGLQLSVPRANNICARSRPVVAATDVLKNFFNDAAAAAERAAKVRELEQSLKELDQFVIVKLDEADGVVRSTQVRLTQKTVQAAEAEAKARETSLQLEHTSAQRDAEKARAAAAEQAAEEAAKALELAAAEVKTKGEQVAEAEHAKAQEVRARKRLGIWARRARNTAAERVAAAEETASVAAKAKADVELAALQATLVAEKASEARDAATGPEG